MTRASFAWQELCNELDSLGCDFFLNKTSNVCIFVTLSDTTANMGDAFCSFPLYAASGYFGYANETSGSRLR